MRDNEIKESLMMGKVVFLSRSSMFYANTIYFSIKYEYT